MEKPQEQEEKKTPDVQPALGLFGVTINSMALIAPGAFLWTTYFLQMVCADSKGQSFAPDVFVGIIFAAWVAFMTAFPFAELARVYPEAGAGGPYYFAERAFKHSNITFVRSWTSFMKWYMGWAVHLYYWIYPGVTVALMTQTIQYLIDSAPSRAGSAPITAPAVCAIAVLCAGLVAAIAIRGINFSTTFNIGVVIMQSFSIVIFAALWASFRSKNPLNLPPEKWLFPNTGDILKVHSGIGMLYQSSIAILNLVGFDSATQLGAETIRPERNVTIGCVLSLALQALISYPIEYISATAAMPLCFADCETDTPLGPATASSPIGELTKMSANAFGLNGYALMVLLATTVLLSIFGTTLAASNSAVRLSMFLSAEGLFPAFLRKLHPKYRTPYTGILLSFVLNATLGMAGASQVTKVVNATTGPVGFPDTTAMTAITMASNIGTFFLYAGICFTCIVQFWGKPEFNWWRHLFVPGVGCVLNLLEIMVIYTVAFLDKDLPYPLNQTATAAYIALGIMTTWLVAYATLVFAGVRGYWTNKKHLSAQLEEWSLHTRALAGLPSGFPGHEDAKAVEDWSLRPRGTSLMDRRHDSDDESDSDQVAKGGTGLLPLSLGDVVPCSSVPLEGCEPAGWNGDGACEAIVLESLAAVIRAADVKIRQRFI